MWRPVEVLARPVGLRVRTCVRVKPVLSSGRKCVLVSKAQFHGIRILIFSKSLLVSIYAQIAGATG